MSNAAIKRANHKINTNNSIIKSVEKLPNEDFQNRYPQIIHPNISDNNESLSLIKSKLMNQQNMWTYKGSNNSFIIKKAKYTKFCWGNNPKKPLNSGSKKKENDDVNMNYDDDIINNNKESPNDYQIWPYLKGVKYHRNNGINGCPNSKTIDVNASNVSKNKNQNLHTYFKWTNNNKVKKIHLINKNKAPLNRNNTSMKEPFNHMRTNSKRINTKIISNSNSISLNKTSNNELETSESGYKVHDYSTVDYQGYNHKTIEKYEDGIRHSIPEGVDRPIEKVNKYKSVWTKFACKTKAGINMNGCTKTNQDSYMAKINIFNSQNYSAFGVFDGHGMNGHLVSRLLKDYFLQVFTKKENFLDYVNSYNETLFLENVIMQKLLDGEFMKSCCWIAEEKIKKQKFDSLCSGSTAVFIVHIGDKLICYNIGDSRAIYINDNDNVYQISRDHKPNLFDEQSRIISSGGRVARFPGCGNSGPFRVWLRNEEYPGLAMSRSWGDFIAESVGVICEPEIYEWNIVKNRIKAVILASDGLWEFMANEVVAEFVKPFIRNNDCVGASKKLVDEALKSWVRNGIICDDITVIVLFFKH